jgi:hypothetical protein
MGILHMHYCSARQMARLRQIVIISGLCLAIYCFLLAPEESLDRTRWTNSEAYQSRPQHLRQREEERDTLPPELLNNRFLTEDQCRVSFPGLLEQVDNEVAKGPFKLERYANDLGPLIARIRDGQVGYLTEGFGADEEQERQC